jgi:penicillin amidase
MGGPQFLSWDFNPGLRAERIEQLLLVQEKHDLDSFRAIQLDQCNTLGLRLSRRLQTLPPPPSELERRALVLLQQWDGKTAIASVGAAVYQVVLASLAEIVLRETLGPELSAEVFGEVSFNPLSHIAHHASRYHGVLVTAVERNDARWLPEGENGDPQQRWNDLLTRALAQAVPRLVERLGEDPAQWRWGRLHKLELRHPLSSLGWFFPRLGPAPIGGDSEAVAQTGLAYQDGMPGEITVGASWRYLARLAELQDSRTSHCPGQSGHPGSPHYQDGFPLWLRGVYRCLWKASAKATLEVSAIPASAGSPPPPR